jgi:hypothetical protein
LPSPFSTFSSLPVSFSLPPLSFFHFVSVSFLFAAFFFFISCRTGGED